MASSFLSASLKSYLQQYRNQISRRTKTTFIFPTWLGVGFGLVCFFLILAGYLYQNNFLFLYVFFITSLGLTSMFSANQNIVKAKLERAIHFPVYLNQRQKVQVVLQGSQLGHQILGSFNKKESESVEPFMQGQSTIYWQAEKMGWQQAPMLMLLSFYPFGFFRVWKNLQIEDDFFVIPTPIDHLANPVSAAESQEQKVQSLRMNDEIDFEGHKEYQAGDPVARIDWRASSRTERLLLKKFKTTDMSPQIISWKDTEKLIEFELRAEQMAFWCKQAQDMGINCEIQFEQPGSLQKFELHEFVDFFKALFEVYRK